MVINTAYKGKEFQGETYPIPINPKSFGLTELGIQLIPYVRKTEPNTPKAFKEIEFRQWLKELNFKGVHVLLWKGKSDRLTLQQREYARQEVQGALLIPYSTLMNKFRVKVLDRQVKIKGREFLNDILKGKKDDRSDGLLYKLNARMWTVVIYNASSKVLLEKTKLTEDRANQILRISMKNLEEGRRI